jgi:Ankyrin repeats (3 copies)/Ankyrin repeats (many copies)
VYCQLDNLRRCVPSSIREILNELPANLDDTYERILHGIPKQIRRHAHRLFQCMVAASRPLRVEELAEIITIEFGLAGALSAVVKGWRPTNPEEAVLSACSVLISIIVDEKGSKIVQFSHVSVKEFLTSDRIRTMDVGKISQYHVALEPAHMLLARLCLTALLQLDENVDKTRLANSPLVLYAAQHWVDHANFGHVASRIQDAMERLFNPMKPHFRAWIWLRRSANKQSMENIDERPPQLKLTPLYYAAFFGFGDLARRLIVTHKENVNASFNKWTALHAASEGGHLGAVRVLLDHGARMNAQLDDGRNPLHLASYNGHLKVVQLLLERRAASNLNNQADLSHPLCLAAESGHIEVVRAFLDHGADVNIQDERVWSPYEAAKMHGQHDVARLLQDLGGK